MDHAPDDINIRVVKCPHCTVTFHESWESSDFTADRYAWWGVRWTECSACGRAIIELVVKRLTGRAKIGGYMVWPKGAARPVAPEVPDPYSRDFKEACTVLPDSTNASAAISRRCLQSLLINEGGAKKGNLADQIDEVVDSKQLRPQLGENLHYVRKVGNLGAHETKNAKTGEVVDATKEEAEWLIEVLEGLFEHFFVEPEREKRRREEFDTRMASAKEKTEPDAGHAATTAVLGQGQSSQVD